MRRPKLQLVLAVLSIVALATSVPHAQCATTCEHCARQHTAAATSHDGPTHKSCCANKTTQATEGVATPTSSIPATPCGACCQQGEPLAKPELARHRSSSELSVPLLAALFSVPTTDVGTHVPAIDVSLAASDPPLRVLLCVWRN